MAQLVSVIITSQNEEGNIANCIESIKRQTFHKEKTDIIVVDNYSTDKTEDIAKRYTDKVFSFGPERSAQRNFGVKQATSKYIFYLDSDMILSEDVIAESVHKCENEGCAALYIPEKIIGKGFWIKVRDFERSFYNGTVIDCVRFVRRDKFLKVNGFDENLTGPEDWDFDRRVREICKAGIIKAQILHNEKEFNLGRYLEKKFYYAKSFAQYIQKWGSNDCIIKKQLGFWYRYFGVFVENGKWRRLLSHLNLSLGMYLLRFLVGIIYLRSLKIYRWRPLITQIFKKDYTDYSGKF